MVREQLAAPVAGRGGGRDRAEAAGAVRRPGARPRSRSCSAQRGGAFYSEAAVDLLAALTADRGDTHVVNVRNDGTLPFLPDDEVVEVPRHRAPGTAPVGSSARAPLPPDVAGLVAHVDGYEHLALDAALHGGRPRRAALLAHPLVGQDDLADRLTDRLLAGNRSTCRGHDDQRRPDRHNGRNRAHRRGRGWVEDRRRRPGSGRRGPRYCPGCGLLPGRWCRRRPGSRRRRRAGPRGARPARADRRRRRDGRCLPVRLGPTGRDRRLPERRRPASAGCVPRVAASSWRTTPSRCCGPGRMPARRSPWSAERASTRWRAGETGPLRASRPSVGSLATGAAVSISASAHCGTRRGRSTVADRGDDTGRPRPAGLGSAGRGHARRGPPPRPARPRGPGLAPAGPVHRRCRRRRRRGLGRESAG